MSDAPQTAIARRNDTPAAKLNLYLTARAKNLAQYARNAIRPDTLIRLAVFEFANNQYLARSSPESVYASLVTAAQLGLEPSGVRGEAYLVPYGGRCTLVPGWRGLVKLALRSKAVKTLYSHVVYEGDDFVVRLGTDPAIHHVPLLNSGSEQREVIAAYAVAQMENGAIDIEVMDRHELDKVRAFAASNRGGKDGPAYATWADQMYRKAPIRRLCKRLPLGDDYFLAAKLDELHDAGKPEQIGSFIDVPTDETNDPGPLEDGAPQPSAIQRAAEKAR